MKLIWGNHSNLDKYEKAVLLRLADFSDKAGGNIFPKILNIAKDTSLSKRKVLEVLKSLNDKNYLSKAKMEFPTLKRRNTYTINVTKLTDEYQIARGKTP